MKNLLIFVLLTILIILNYNSKENLSYEDKRQYFYCKYRLNPNSPKCKYFFDNLNEKRQPHLVGIIYTKEEDNDKSYNLYKNHNELNNEYQYYIKIVNHDGSYILKRIYSSKMELFSNQEINLPNHNNNPYIIQLYENNTNNCNSCKILPNGKRTLCNNCWNSQGTRYDHALINWNNVGYVYKVNGKKDRFFNLYEKRLDPSRNNYRYYIQDVKQDVKIMLPYENELYHNSSIKVNGKQGDYMVHKYDMEHPSYPLF